MDVDWRRVGARSAASMRRAGAGRGEFPSIFWELSDKFYSERVQPLLAAMSASAIARRISVSRCYAGRIREGYRPHPRCVPLRNNVERSRQHAQFLTMQS